MSKFLYALPALALACFIFAGCQEETPAEGGGDNGGTSTAGNTGHSHDGGTGHNHDLPLHGPNGGHTFTWGEEHGYFAEWKHYSDNNVIRFYVLTEEMENVPVKAESFTVRRASGDDETVFTLDPEQPDENGAAVIYSLDDQNLAIAMNLGTIVEMKIGDKTYKADIPAHEPHDH